MDGLMDRWSLSAAMLRATFAWTWNKATCYLVGRWEVGTEVSTYLVVVRLLSARLMKQICNASPRASSFSFCLRYYCASP
jgi:hypothetical protein